MEKSIRCKKRVMGSLRSSAFPKTIYGKGCQVVGKPHTQIAWHGQRSTSHRQVSWSHQSGGAFIFLSEANKFSLKHLKKLTSSIWSGSKSFRNFGRRAARTEPRKLPAILRAGRHPRPLKKH